MKGEKGEGRSAEIYHHNLLWNIPGGRFFVDVYNLSEDVLTSEYFITTKQAFVATGVFVDADGYYPITRAFPILNQIALAVTDPNNFFRYILVQPSDCTVSDLVTKIS